MKEQRLILISIEVLLLLAGLTAGGSPPGELGRGSSKSSQRLAPCQVCKVLVSSFLRGMEITSKGHYGGGDTAWEEENKKSYKNSELRLTEIEESLCSDVTTGKDQCHEIAADNEELINEWWHKHRNAGEDLLTWFCISKLKVCCQENHYGPKCLKCPGFPDNICSGHGKCKGQGTRKGNGDCSCELGYSGKLCDSCAPLYYQMHQDEQEETRITCSECHKACMNGCSGSGSESCEGCKVGWEVDKEKGCTDVNECLLEKTPCKINEFCLNSEGSYSCIACDKSCTGCFGEGPDMCDNCAEGYNLKNKICLEESSVGTERNINTARYLTYVGLALATCIIFKKNSAISIAVGVASASYIATTEYLLSGSV